MAIAGFKEGEVNCPECSEVVTGFTEHDRSYVIYTRNFFPMTIREKYASTVIPDDKGQTHALVWIYQENDYPPVFMVAAHDIAVKVPQRSSRQ